MPLRLAELQAGDIVLCYEWNTVAKLQATVKTLKRGMDAIGAASGASLLAQIGNPVPYFAGTAKCNHAMIIGSPSEESYLDAMVVNYAPAEPGEKVSFSKSEGGATLLRRTVGERTVEEDITDLTIAHGALERVKIKDRKRIELFFSKSKTRQLPNLCHSTGGGCTWVPAEVYFANHTGSVAVFRPVAEGRGGALAREAGTVAKTWANEFGRHDPRIAQYSTWKAFWSALGSHVYGSGASGRAAKYRLHRAREGGPPSDANSWNPSPWANRTGRKEWFCSMFVIACYHAASADDGEARRFLPLDAKHTTPMTLDGFLSTSRAWRLVGRSP
jgi:hypothetical protein